ncbi:hypothetical protein [Dyella sp. ASV21]|uniref:hypothetical protein n=1 Tax=Dyella sp. ASV21 TaxID=2795114 RepID=UPI0018EBC2AC|nr:hypothetical protein [Dyella sp. ASV21]
MSVLNNLRNDVAAASAKAAATANVTPIADRKHSDFWLNIGITIDGPDGEPLFVSLPVGLALDDMKPQAIKGTNQDWINLAQTKNALLEALQKHAASMEPGARQPIDCLQVELYRRNEPAQHGTTEGNPLVASLMATLAGKKAA